MLSALRAFLSMWIHEEYPSTLWPRWGVYLFISVAVGVMAFLLFSSLSHEAKECKLPGLDEICPKVKEKKAAVKKEKKK